MQQDLKAEAKAHALAPALIPKSSPAPATLPPPPAPPFEPEIENDPLDRAASRIDQVFHGALAKATNGGSPMALAGAYADWAVHLALSPGKQAQLIGKALRKSARLADIAVTGLLCPRYPQSIEPLPQDTRFASEDWRTPPFHQISQAFLLQQQWWHNAMTGVRGVTRQHENVVEFSTRQWLDMFSPSNFILSNPVVLRATVEAGGANLLKGFANLIDDCSRLQRGARPAGAEKFAPGREVAVTEGKVVYRNRLIELIEYAPKTATVRSEPILIVPAWIMKYYILDLSPGNSLARFLVDQGFTVFMISWRNPDESDRDLGMEDYRQLGVMSALDAISGLLPGGKVHAVGYCLGGTLLSIAAAAMARDGDDRLQSLTLFAAQVDFTEAGELTLFINESQVSFLEDLMRGRGYLDGPQMAGAFQLLRSKDLIWSKVVQDYLLGQREPMSDLMAWNADATRLPFRMHSEYLRRLFLHNDLAEGRFESGGSAVALSDIRIPIFALGAERDHVAPWRSVYKIDFLASSGVTFVLTSGGHNAGVVSEPGHRGRHFRVRAMAAQDGYLDPDHWFALTAPQEGSWWPQWAAWLAGLSSGMEPAPDFARRRSLCAAPGTYVLQA